MSTLREKELRETVIEQASDWYCRHREGNLTTDEQAEFMAWLRASPGNTGEYLAVTRLWNEMKGAIADLRWDAARLFEHAQEQGTVVPFGAERTRVPLRIGRRAVPIGLIAASVLVAAFVFYGRPEVITAGPDIPRVVSLDDGSVLRLNVDSRVKVRFSSRERRIELDRGQAFFEVAHELHRPFRVEAGSADVVAVGTQFDVAHRGRQVTVTVVEGKVNVRSDAGSALPLRLEAGDQIRIDGQSHTLSQDVDLRAATAWMRREIIFDGHRLAEVVREFNRYLHEPIEIEDPQLLQLQVSGVFDTYDAESFLRFLRQYEVDIERREGAIHVRPHSSEKVRQGGGRIQPASS